MRGVLCGGLKLIREEVKAGWGLRALILGCDVVWL